MMTKTSTRKRVRVSQKTTLIVVLVIVSVALGGYLLNMAIGAQIFSSTSSSNWVYVLGKDRCTSAAVNNLINSINSGADVKILLVKNKFQQECTAVGITPGSVANTFDINCYLSGRKNILLAGPSVVEDLSVMTVNSSKPCEMHWLYSEDRITNAGVHEFSAGGNDYGDLPIKWFVKK